MKILNVFRNENDLTCSGKGDILKFCFVWRSSFVSKNKPMTRARIKYIFSYVAACVLPLVACAALILSNNYSVGIKQQDQYADSALALVKTQLDLKFKNLESASMHFASNMLENGMQPARTAMSVAWSSRVRAGSFRKAPAGVRPMLCCTAAAVR